MGGGRLGVKKCGRWEIGGQKLWEVGDWGSKYVGGGRLAPLCHPPLLAADTPAEIVAKNMSQLRNLFVWILSTDFKIISMYVTRKSLFTIIVINLILNRH